MGESSSFASLGPTLLARKGGARPAMRSQINVFSGLERSPDHHGEDLGWNDMGEQHVADVVQLNAANEGAGEVHRQQHELTAKLTQPKQAGEAPARSRRSALEDGRRAAFTLRLDSERHLKLRLACTIKNRSAQQLVTDALDQLLAGIADLDVLAGKVKRK